jgi:hypothetical protein
MNKEDIKNLIKELDIPKDKYCILTSGSLLFYGLRDKVDDLDLHVTFDVFDKLKQIYDLEPTNKGYRNHYKLNDKIELLVADRSEFNVDYVDGYQVETLESILVFKRQRNTPKDQMDIENITNYLNKNRK